MAQSNAERQKRYRQRLKALAANGGNAVRKLNKTYNAAAAEQRDNAVREIRRKIARSKDENYVLAMEEMIDRLPPPSYQWTLDDWCRIAQLLGKADEAANVADAEQEALRQLPKRQPLKTPKRPWAPFRHVTVTPQKNNRKFSSKLNRPPWATFTDEDPAESGTSQTPSPELV